MKKIILFFVTFILTLSASAQNLGFPDSIRAVEFNSETGSYRFKMIEENFQPADFKVQEKAMSYSTLFDVALAHPDSLIVAGTYTQIIDVVSWFKAEQEYHDYGIMYDSSDNTIYFKKSAVQERNVNSLIMLPAMASVALMMMVGFTVVLIRSYRKELDAYDNETKEIDDESKVFDEEDEISRRNLNIYAKELTATMNVSFYASALVVLLLAASTALTLAFIKSVFFPLIILLIAFFFAMIYLFQESKRLYALMYYLLMIAYFAVVL